MSKTKDKPTLQELLNISEQANFALVEEIDRLKTELINERTLVIRIPKQIYPSQYNNLCKHLAEIRPQFMQVLEAPLPLEAPKPGQGNGEL